MMGKQQGLVIVAVLWICALVMWMALQTSANIRLKNEEDIQQYRRSESLYYAISGVYEALAHMGESLSLDSESEDSWQPDGRLKVVKYAGGEATVMVEEETKKVNVNKANPEQIKAVLERSGLDSDTAEMMADRISDFIDGDDLPRLQGAEDDAYEDEGIGYPPFNGELLSLDQLLLVPGIGPALFYGQAAHSGETSQEDNEASWDPAFPRRDSLFDLLTVYGNNTELDLLEGGETLAEENDTETITWASDATYRILSAGRAAGGGAPVVIRVVCKYSPAKPKGYEILYQKVL